jgi:hypothetical protein
MMYQLQKLKLTECLDAQICSLSWVSFGLEPATDGSGRFTHLLHRDGSGSTTTPSTSTVTSGTDCRPLQRSARCHLAAYKHGGRIRAGSGRRPLTRVGCGLSRQWQLSAVRRRVAGRLRRTYSGRSVGRTTTAAVIRAGARGAPFAGGVITRSDTRRPGPAATHPCGVRGPAGSLASGGSRPFAGAWQGGSAGPIPGAQWAARLPRLSSGRRLVAPCSPEESSRVCRRPSRAAVTTIVRAGAGALCSPEWSSLRLTAAGRAEHATACGAPCSPEASLGRLSASWLRGIRDW